MKDMQRRCRWVFCLCVANALAALGTPFAASFAVGLCYTVITSKYRVLESREVINHQKLAEVWGDDVASDWGLTVKSLIYDPLTSFFEYSFIVAALFAANGAFWLSLWVQMRREK